MKKKSIVFVDSGVGGLHIMANCQKMLPNYDCIYIADTFNAPYGNKSQKQLIKIAKSLTQNILEKYNPEIIVFACNTLTINTLEKVRERFYKTKIVGVEPAIKTAKVYGGDTIIFATKGTIKNYHKLCKKVDKQLKKEYNEQNLRYRNKDKVFKVYSKTLPKLIDDNIDNLDSLQIKINQLFQNKKYKNCVNMVLGCTHFLAIKEQINCLFKNIKFFDGAKAVANRIYSLANYKGVRKYVDSDICGKVEIICTDGDLIKQQKFMQYYKKICSW